MAQVVWTARALRDLAALREYISRERPAAADFARHADHIHFNPVKHSHARRVKDRRHSSFHRFVRLGFYPKDWAGSPEDDQRDGFGE